MVVRAYARLVLTSFVPLCLSTLQADASPRAPVDQNVTVLLFHTSNVQRLQVRSSRAVLRLCDSCTAQTGPVALDLQVAGGSMVDARGTKLRSVAIAGAAQVVAGEHQRATAAGTWTIDLDHDHLRVRVALSRERYVEAVLAAEAGASAPMEALKALAVTARSFAAVATNRHAEANFCDTTHCQALRLETVSPVVREAVWSTSGETLWYGNHTVAGYFSQHCGGITEDAAQVWGGKPLPWLTAQADSWCARVPSQWHASFSVDQVRDALRLESFQVSAPIEAIMAVDRDRSGRIGHIRLRAGGNTLTLPAATLRFALNRHYGWNQLRSDRYQVRRVGDRIVFEGSGYGHGVGLCQAGAEAMAKAGKGYREILATYFPHTNVRMRAADTGWLTTTMNGFTLRTTARDPELNTVAAQAFADARTRWGSPAKAGVSLTVFPTTEAFRQATDQPGWELASTQANRIATQPPSLLATHGGAGAVLRHEFLHSFVEGEAAPGAPLWLREGLVAVLDDEPCPVPLPEMNPAAVDEALRAPASLMQSQRAHAAACSLVRKLIAERGPAAARAMLQHP